MFELLHDKFFHPSGSDENDFEVIVAQPVRVPVIYESDSIMFFKFIQDGFMRMV